MQETYLKHLTIALVSAFAGIGALLHPEWAVNTFVLWGVILGYVFKNGTATRPAPLVRT